MNYVVYRAYAKVNLFLGITGKRSDGYHCLDTVMMSCDIPDVVRLEKTDGGISVVCDAETVPDGPSNIAYRAAETFFRAAALPGGVRVTIQKGIPSQAGLGGGSADAAAVLHGLNRLYGAPLTPERLLGLAPGIGADVPFCMLGGCAEMTGIGQNLRRRFALPRGYFTVIKPPAGISTPAAFAEIDRRYPRFDCEKVLAGAELLASYLQKKKPLGQCGFLYNVFEEILPTVSPETAELLCFLRTQTSASLMTGSGNAVCGFFGSRRAANVAAAEAKKRYPDHFVCVARPVKNSLLTEEEG